MTSTPTAGLVCYGGNVILGLVPIPTMEVLLFSPPYFLILINIERTLQVTIQNGVSQQI